MGCGVGHGADYEGDVGAGWKTEFGVVAFEHCGWVGGEVFHAVKCWMVLSIGVCRKWCMQLLEIIRS